MDIECDIRIRNATPEELAPFHKAFASSNTVKASRQGTPQNFQVAPWSDEEKAAITGRRDGTEAWADYHEQFPESTRTRDAVRRKFQNLKDEEPAPAITYKVAPGAETPVTVPAPPAAKKPSKRDAALKNAQAPRWTDPEKEIIKNHVKDPDFTAA